MKRMKLSFLKRIFVLFCCTVLLSFSVFASYSMTVYAVDDFDVSLSVINVCLIIGGLVEIAVSGGTLSPLAVMQISVALAGEGKVIYDYVTENADGTYTIDPTLVQAVMDAAEQLEAQGFTDADIANQKKGNYTLHFSTFDRQFLCDKHNVAETCTISCSANVINGLFACHVSSPDKYDRYSLAVNGSYNNSIIDLTKKMKFSCGYEEVRSFSYLISGHSYGANIPIFTDNDSLRNYLNNGTGYKNAENYRAQPLFRRHSSYTPTYSGGPITVNRTVVQNIASKISEVDADDTKSDDEKIEILRQYILSGGTGGGTGDGTGGGGGDKDYDDNKDLPAGTDLTDTNSWLKKIYLKVCQISDKMSASAGKTLDDVVTSVDDLGRMLKKYLSEITGDLDDIKGQLEQISEQEFTEKTDSFMEENKESFSEITDVAKTKFPFSLLSDIGKLLSVFRSPPPEQAAQSFNMTASYADDGESVFTYGDKELLTVYEGGTGETLQRSDTGAPVFSLPLVITSLGWNYFIVIDMSEFQSIADMMRTLFTLIYIYGMIKFSFPVIELWGVLID